MSGIRIGTRLEQLLKLRDRIDQEIALERRTIAERRIVAHKIVVPPTRPDVDTAARLLRLGVTPKQVKYWALTQGLITTVPRGRVNPHLVDAYETALTAPQEAAS